MFPSVFFSIKYLNQPDSCSKKIMEETKMGEECGHCPGCSGAKENHEDKEEQENIEEENEGEEKEDEEQEEDTEEQSKDDDDEPSDEEMAEAATEMLEANADEENDIEEEKVE